jgi:hypothetical protein
MNHDELRPDDALPRSPTGRVPQWVIDERSGRAPTTIEPWRSAHVVDIRNNRRGRPRRSWSTGVSVTVVLLLLGGVAAWDWAKGTQPAHLASARPTGWPSAVRDPSTSPLGSPEPPASTNTSFGFVALETDNRTPVRYDPCRPIHYVVRPQGEPIGGDAIISDAVARISRATGLQFQPDGATDEAPSSGRAPFQPDRYGDRWAPVLITWSTVAEAPDLAADVLGEAGSERVGFTDGPSVYVTGLVQLDARQFAETLAHPGGAQIARAAVIHELGHLVGLAHVSDRSQLMYPQIEPNVLDLAAGDLTGLSELGRGPCVPGI